jgi:hypothetical protein
VQHTLSVGIYIYIFFKFLLFYYSYVHTMLGSFYIYIYILLQKVSYPPLIIMDVRVLIGDQEYIKRLVFYFTFSLCNKSKKPHTTGQFCLFSTVLLFLQQYLSHLSHFRNPLKFRKDHKYESFTEGNCVHPMYYS